MKPQEFSEAEVQQILSRAVQIDAAAPERLKLEQIRAIAAELGVSQAAVERAIEEYGAERGLSPASAAAVDRPARARQQWFRQPLAVAALILAVLFAAILGARLVSEAPVAEPEVQISVP